MDFYGIISKGYDRLYKNEQESIGEIILENFEISKNDILLDVGCGTGISGKFNCTTINLDKSFDMISLNKTNNRVIANAESLPFKNNIFDKVVSITAIHNFTNFRKAISEILRVGKKDFAISILNKSEKFDSINEEIQKMFDIKKIINTRQDRILICSKIFK
jgi:ubiquinone/menaquinone biosynthesis C-methylase UbiE